VITPQQTQDFTENLNNADLSAPQLPEGIDAVNDSELESRAANFDYPQHNQPLDYGGWYMYKASYNSSSSRSAILVRQNGKDFWNNYWGGEGVSRTHNIITGSSAHNQLEAGRVEVFLWHRINNNWVYQGKINNNLRLNWVDPLPEANLMTSDYGDRILNNAYDYHAGVDFGHCSGAWVVDGKPVRAVAGGTVVESTSSYGMVTIDHGDYLTRYIHMKNLIPVNSVVAAGTQIGTVSGVGAAGTVSYTPHLHFEYYDQSSLPIYSPDDEADDPSVHLCYIPTIGINNVDTDEDESNTYQNGECDQYPALSTM